jgi:hypothetical protein
MLVEKTMLIKIGTGADDETTQNLHQFGCLIYK